MQFALLLSCERAESQNGLYDWEIWRKVRSRDEASLSIEGRRFTSDDSSEKGTKSTVNRPRRCSRQDCFRLLQREGLRVVAT
ncbi:hypothetical protein CC2G_013723 [Coprinopsis cinerea AmutBmut pab1-1]|nr:hypothetical protein CC2G_013723 [Coprinopsis cinerea AmutBmut pab1-1]